MSSPQEQVLRADRGRKVRKGEGRIESTQEGSTSTLHLKLGLPESPPPAVLVPYEAILQTRPTPGSSPTNPVLPLKAQVPDLVA